MNWNSRLMHALPISLLIITAYILISLPETLIDSDLAKLSAMLVSVSVVMTVGKIRASIFAYCAGLIVAWPSIVTHISSYIQQPTADCDGCNVIGSFFKVILAMITFCGFAASLLPIGALLWYFSRSRTSRQQNDASI